MRVHFVLHETFEVPGAYLKWAQERGHQVTMSKVYEREALLETVDEIAQPSLTMIRKLRLNLFKKQ